MSSEPAARPPLQKSRAPAARGAAVLALGCIVLAAPLFLAGPGVFTLVGLALAVSGALELLEAFYVPVQRGKRAGFLAGGLSVLAGLLFLARPVLLLSALILFVGLAFLAYGVARLVAAWRARPAAGWAGGLAAGFVNVALGALLGSQWPGFAWSAFRDTPVAGEVRHHSALGLWAVAVPIAAHLLSAGWALLFTSPEGAPEAAALPEVGLHPDRKLKLPPHPELARLEEQLAAEVRARRPIDTYWCLTFVLTFFAIHVGRIGADWDLVGLVGPGFAVVGDVFTALLLAFAVVLPLRLLWRALTRPLERRAWAAVLAYTGKGRRLAARSRLVRAWLVWRLGFALRMRQARGSPRAALRWGLQTGLPLTAVVIATTPIWGFSWYFNTENWATELYNQWAETRTDRWREEMMAAVRERYLAAGTSEDRLFLVEPEGVAAAGDFSFLVIGDTGEGDASQHCLRDQLVLLGSRPEVRFLVICSDVIYPAGAMRDYEANFYLPFKGFTKPLYALPGNHDWYDALEGFAANFFEADAARAAMRARVAADHGVSATTDERIDRLIAEAARLRREYGVRNGLQRGPYFELQTERFALILVDTGVVRGIDAPQWAWLESALRRARGKFTMVVPGHPLYAAGRYQGEADERFAALHRLLRRHQVEVVMAGDWHDLEYYREGYATDGGGRWMHHFVNGGGGAYLSLGTALSWPGRPAVPDCAFYPRTDAVIAKLDAQTPAWKQPLWFWVKRLGAWPSSPEAMSAAFGAFNRAPFQQSFFEVRVEGSANVVRLRPYGASGRLRWRDLQVHGQVIPAGQTENDLAEFTVPMPGNRE